jgi:hypothetical protein
MARSVCFRPVVCLVGCAALVGLVGRASTAQACSCDSRGASIVWPRDGALDAALDAPLVLAAFHVERAQVSLEAQDGTPVELVERRRLEHGGDFSCSNANYVFLTPAVPLEPNTRYLVTRRYEDDPKDILNGHPPVRDNVRSFTPGTELRSTRSDLTLHLFAANNEHGASTGRGQGMLLELYAETSWLEPLFVLARGETGPQLRDWDPDLRAAGEASIRRLSVSFRG